MEQGHQRNTTLRASKTTITAGSCDSKRNRNSVNAYVKLILVPMQNWKWPNGSKGGNGLVYMESYLIVKSDLLDEFCLPFRGTCLCNM